MVQANSTTQVSIKNLIIIEFLLSTINLKQILTKDKLRALFKIFDAENAGTISLEEVRGIIRQNGVKEFKPTHWQEILLAAGHKEGSATMKF